MIDWHLVLSGATWILGLAVILSAFSHAQWHASLSGQRLREALGRPTSRLWRTLGLVLFVLGWAARPGMSWWLRSLWAAVAMMSAWELVGLVAAARRSTPDKTPHE